MDNLEDIDNNIKKIHGLYLFQIIRHNYKTIKGYRYHETCDKITRDLYSNYKDIDGATEWFSVLQETIWIAGASPHLVIDGLNKKCTPFKYNIHAKVVETYINFYFYFFKELTVTNSSMKIANWLNDNLTEDEYHKIISRFPDDEIKCLSESLLQYNKIKDSINKCYVYFQNNSECDMIKWTIKSESGTDIISGYSSNISYAESDACRSACDLIQISPSCEFIFV